MKSCRQNFNQTMHYIDNKYGFINLLIFILLFGNLKKTLIFELDLVVQKYLMLNSWL